MVSGGITWKNSRWGLVLLAILGLLPAIGVGIVGYQYRDNLNAMANLLRSIWWIGAGSICWIALLQYKFFGESVTALNRKPASLREQIFAALVMLSLMLAAAILFRNIFGIVGADAFRGFDAFYAELKTSYGKFLVYVAYNLLLWVGFEEFVRTFVLSRLWDAFPSRAAQWAWIMVSAIVYGFVYLYQGIGASFSAAMVGIVMGAYYFYYGRPVPMIAAHYLYNAFLFLLVFNC